MLAKLIPWAFPSAVADGRAIRGSAIAPLPKGNGCAAATIPNAFLLTYDDTTEIRNFAEEFSLSYKTIPMQTTHLIKKEELLISDNFEWFDDKKCQYA